MAEGWVRELKRDESEPYSAGLEKHITKPLAVKVMTEKKVEISTQQSKVLEELPIQVFDYVITLCGHVHETCPYFPRKIIHRGFDDPPALSTNADTEKEKLYHYRRVRDEIKHFVETLPQSLLIADEE